MRASQKQAARLALLAGCVLMISGCRTVSPMPPVDLTEPGWTLHQGQAVWLPQRGGNELVGSLLVASNPADGDYVRFNKDPIEIVTVRRDASRWWVSAPSVGRHHAGRGRAPRRLIWFHLCDGVFRTMTHPDWTWTLQPSGAWRLENLDSGERLEGIFIR